LEQIRKADEISLEAPPGMNANKEGRVVVETIAASVSWTPKDAPSCSITPPEQFILRWEYTNPLARSRYRAAEQKADGNSRTRVSHGTSLVPVLDGNGKPLLAVRVQAFFAVDDAGHCCGAEGDYSVIQWVRHEWNLKENPVKAGGDDWSLDVLDSEIQRAAASQPYDPTFTHNPRGTQPAAEPLTYPGPDPDGNLSINQIDRPGIPAALYDRFQRANPNSTFTFHFVAMLVCRQDPSTAQGFRNSGHVKAIIEYKLVIKFNGRGTEPQVTLEKPSVSAFDSCKEFNKVLEQFDRQARNAKQGSPIAGYEHPRDHKLAIPK
jgi:hypothetical protein